MYLFSPVEYPIFLNRAFFAVLADVARHYYLLLDLCARPFFTVRHFTTLTFFFAATPHCRARAAFARAAYHCLSRGCVRVLFCRFDGIPVTIHLTATWILH
jgi:hypothetical protein